MSNWKFGFWDCFGDRRECLYSCCCGPCARADMNEQAFGEPYIPNCLSVCCLGWCCGGFVGVVMGARNRQKIKRRYGIAEDNNDVSTARLCVLNFTTCVPTRACIL